MFKKYVLATSFVACAGLAQAGSIPSTAILESGTGSVSGNSILVADNFDWFVDSSALLGAGFSLSSSGFGLFNLDDFGTLETDAYGLNNIMVSGDDLVADLSVVSSEIGAFSAGDVLVVQFEGATFADGGLTEFFDFWSANPATLNSISWAVYDNPVAAPIPLPAGAVLMLTGVGGFVAMRRKRAS